jgi:hypothetical protein
MTPQLSDDTAIVTPLCAVHLFVLFLLIAHTPYEFVLFTSLLFSNQCVLAGSDSDLDDDARTTRAAERQYRREEQRVAKIEAKAAKEALKEEKRNAPRRFAAPKINPYDATPLPLIIGSASYLGT